MKDLSSTDGLFTEWQAWQRTKELLDETYSMLNDPDPSMRAMADEEYTTLSAKLTTALETNFPKLLVPATEDTSALSAYVELKAGVGGSEATLFVNDLMNMYLRVSQSMEWTANIVSSSEVDGGGFRDVIIEVRGNSAYDTLRFETGVHRVQRVPATETKGRTHTSTVAVLVLPVPEDEASAETSNELYSLADVRIEVMRSRGAGGQHVNKTESAVRLTHIPTGITVSMQDERSQHQNRRRAFRILQARLLDRKLTQDVIDRRAARRDLVKSADRSEKIRTYNYAQFLIMLPKVAGQILHHTTRAVAAAQGQAGHTIRNVLQTGPTNLGQWNGPGSSSSGWNGSGPSSGGAKFNSSSSRFHSSYAGAGRAVAQADASGSLSDNLDTSDDGFELLTARDDGTISVRSERRPRSRSLSFTLQATRDSEKRSVLKAVQHHVRAKHAFAVAQDATSESPPDSGLLEAPPPIPPTDPDAAQPEWATMYRALNACRGAKDAEGVKREAAILRSSPTINIKVYNVILDAMRVSRPPGTSLDGLLEVYNEIIARSIRPNVATYFHLVMALTDRDREVQLAIRITKERLTAGNMLGTDLTVTEDRLKTLQAEDNFGPAMTIYKAACVSTNNNPPWGAAGLGDRGVYFALLRSCFFRSDVKQAMDIFKHIEDVAVKTGAKVGGGLFYQMISVYFAADDTKGAEAVFQKYLAYARTNRLVGLTAPISERHWHTTIWNAMVHGLIQCGQPDLGLKLLEQMMDTSAGADFGVTDVPPPNTATYTKIIHSFAQSGDLASALIWFNKLSQQQEAPVLGEGSMPSKPGSKVWIALLLHLASAGMAHEYTQLLLRAHRENVPLDKWHALLALKLNLDHIDANPDLDRDAAIQTLSSVLHLSGSFREDYHEGAQLALRMRAAQTYLRLGAIDKALETTLKFITAVVSSIDVSRENSVPEHVILKRVNTVRSYVATVMPAFLDDTTSITLDQALHLAHAARQAHYSPSLPVSRQILHLYTRDRTDVTEISHLSWDFLFMAAMNVEQGSSDVSESFPSLVMVLQDAFSMPSFDLSHIRTATRDSLAAQLVRKHGLAGATSIVASMSESAPKLLNMVYRELVVLPESTPASVRELVPEEEPKVQINQGLSRLCDEYSMHNSTSVMKCYMHFERGLRSDLYPNPEVLGRLINAVGRTGAVDKVRKLYDAAQKVLAALANDKHRQSMGWFRVEDHMIIALAHAGETDAAYVHRDRILAHGGTPSADAYAALIQRVKDTTDDTANAMMLFHEARSRGVVVNIFLYNTTISKLAKARKVDQALDLFQEMKAVGFRPTSVTYGAVIAACCRVGDAQSAEILFEEMSSQPNFKPRVPPFNTMMQLYTHTKPDRERVLYYAGALRRANVPYTAHTYKLLLDAYGTIEPLDISSMEQTFKQLEADTSVPIHGIHWASLINAYGCANKDLDKAISIFEGIAEHPGSAVPDAICFEALLNVLVTLKRTDLIPQYLEKWTNYGIHMTAYIVNLVIKGYACGGYIEQARAVFESMIDPPEGVAAPNNHAAYDASSNGVPADAPIYREPSTWEAMIRAELGNSNREGALALLERLKARLFPPAVYARISGILSTDTAAIWDRSSSWSPQSPSTE
ncbi:hypothetical protein EUX98_g2008 [Antrodiella citrinella]|uniref:Prokaryotic-type class I peptide chain release factors domain-containing protein n=1 Tax=Antrodiella citrinella TaxID=2447956 RepID=A0A4S4N012_9APHY|nr:hypothetical protein EUX98_g2008 [Antrodiella citrinella]